MKNKQFKRCIGTKVHHQMIEIYFLRAAIYGQEHLENLEKAAIDFLSTCYQTMVRKCRIPSTCPMPL